jgi:hypothetical protein
VRTADNADEAKQKLFLREEKDFALPRHFVSAAQEGAGGMRGGFVFDFWRGSVFKKC